MIRTFAAALVAGLSMMAAPFACAQTSAGDLVRASDGYTYFHGAGSDLSNHDHAVIDCARKANLVAAEPVVPQPGVLVAALHTFTARQNWQANVENCMLALGWDVVRLPDDEGRRIAALAPAAQAAILAHWVGAREVHGEVVRTFAPLKTLWPLRQPAPTLLTPIPPLSLSISEIADPGPAPKLPKLDIRDIGASPDTQVGPNASVIVVRLWTSAPRHQSILVFGKIDEAAGDVQRAELFKVASPVRFLWGPGPLLQTTYVVPVEPGRWRLLAAAQFIQLCLGHPAFDVGPGEAIFAGSFDAAADDILAPDMSLAPVAATLRDAALAARLKPAAWLNAQTSRCDVTLNPGGQLFRYDMPGAAAPAVTVPH